MDGDLELLERWCAGEKRAGNELFGRHFESVYRFFKHKTADDVDDLVQETFLGCLKGRDRFRRQSSFRTYLFAVARHTLYNYWRSKRRAPEELDFNQSSLADLVTTPRSRIARRQERDRLLDALRELPLEQQLVLELHYWEEMDGKQLSEVFEIAEATTRSRLFRARAALRDRLAVTSTGGATRTPAEVGEWVRSLHPAKKEG